MARDLYQEVTNRIIAELETGTAPWVKPWKSGYANNGAMPYNAASKKQYRGINIPLLMGASCAHGSPAFVTFKQALDLGGHVRKGEHGQQVIFWNFIKRAADQDNAGGDDDDDAARAIPFARAYTVFNIAQCDGLQIEPRQVAAPINPDTRNAQLDAQVSNIGARINHGGDSAFYRPSTDSIQLPEFGQFRDASNYYATLLHELTHWTGNKSRLARDLANRFGDQAYAAEELIAELGAAFLCGEHGVTGQLQHAAYLGNWLSVLRQDKRAIFTAASKAQQAADYINAAMVQAMPIAA